MANITQITELYKKIVFITIILFVAINCSYLSFADTIILKDGSEIKGIIIKDTSDEVKLKIKFGTISLKRDDIETIKKEEMTDDLILTEEGVKDQWGLYVPSLPHEIEMLLSGSVGNGEPYFSFAKEYELKAKNESSIPELRQAGLMTALTYYKVASKSSNEAIKKSSLSGIKRCSAQLFDVAKGKIVIPHGTSMTEHIGRFIEELDSEAKKKAYTDIYLEMGQDYEAEAAKDSLAEKQLKNIRIAMSCYLIVMTHSPDEESKHLAHSNYRRCRKLRDMRIAKDDENLQESETVPISQ